MIRIGILGATGYTALELLKILLRHPQVRITQLTTRDTDSPTVDMVHPLLRGQLELSLIPFEMNRFVNEVDCAFCCLPHAASAEVVGPLLDAGIKVVDFSADYRLNDVATFEKWYGVTHPDPSRVGQTPYGIPELFREQICGSSLVANPGCFPSSALLPLAPLLKQNLLSRSSIIVDSKTGVSGAGRKPNLKFHFPECNESLTAYGVGTHRHMPEIDHITRRFCDQEIHTVFTPHLVPMDRGILSTIYCQPNPDTTPANLLDALAEFYRHEPFVRITDQIPGTKDVSGTNFCDITIKRCGETIVIVSVLDNLIKGASGAAVQNFNVIHEFPETMALL